MSIIILASLFSANNTSAQYLLDTTDPSTYSITCGTVNSSSWTVSNNNCTLTTTPYQLSSSPVVQIVSVSITIQGSAMDNADSITIKYSNNGVWFKQTVVRGQPGLHTYTYTFNITANASSFIGLSINMYNNSNSESWRISGGSVSMSNAPLPVELISFSGKKNKDGIKLDWITGSETNCDYFTIEKSNDGNNFCSIEKLAGSGNSVSEKKYFFLDNEATEG